MSIDRAKANFYSGDLIDKVLHVFSGSFTAPSRPDTISLDASHDVGVDDFVYYVGLYNVDGGDYLDLGSETLVGGEEVQCLGGSEAGKLNLYSNNGDTSTHTIGYKIAAISKPSNVLFTPDATSAPQNNAWLSSALNYQKIALEDTVSVTVSAASGSPVDTAKTITHNLGYRPCVRAFIDDGTTLTDPLVRNGVSLVFNNNIVMTSSPDNTSVSFRFTNNSGSAATYNLSYRIYYDSN